MAILDRFQPARQMIALLEHEHRAITTINLDELSRIAPRKEKALEALSRVKLSRSELEVIRRKSARNQTLLEAANKGIRSVRASLTQTRETAASFATYDSKGRSTSLVRKPLTNK